MPETPTYSHNRERFARFYELQREFALRIAAHPHLVKAWIDAQPAPSGQASEAEGSSVAWRMTRLNGARRAALSRLIARAEGRPSEPAPLAAWLARSVPVSTHLDIAGHALPDLPTIDPTADDLRLALLRMREALLAANLGLAKAAIRSPEAPDADELLSAASCGLLHAIDRYVPGSGSASFAYFATFWIRYQINRHLQKNAAVVSFPVNQQRLCRKIDRYLTARWAQGLPAPSDARIREDMKLGEDAMSLYRLRPVILPLELPGHGGTDPYVSDHCLCDPAPGPAESYEASETVDHVADVLRRRVPPAVRLMLACHRGVGSVSAAAEDYLAHLHETGRERMGLVSEASAMIGPISELTVKG